jgi:hypothetical protein
MEDILNQISASLNDIIKSDIVQFGIRAIGLYLVIIWLATAYWAFRDMQQRSDNAILPYIAAAGIILFTPIFFIFAVWIYKIVRPHEKIGEVWERNLAEEALLAEVESIHHCPSCERRIDDEWIICPSCRTRLKRVCPNCSRLVGMEALPQARDVAGRIAAPGGASPTTVTAPAALPTAVGQSGPNRSQARPAGPSIPATAQDPLPER